jgi:hypothetical protein
MEKKLRLFDDSPLMDRDSSALLFTAESPELTIRSTRDAFSKPGSRMK